MYKTATYDTVLLDNVLAYMSQFVFNTYSEEVTVYRIICRCSTWAPVLYEMEYKGNGKVAHIETGD